MRPKFCPNCAAPLPTVSHNTQPWGCDAESYSIEGWDCFCDACGWSGDIVPDYATEEQLSRHTGEGAP